MLINVIVYFLCSHILHLPTTTGTVFAWIEAVLFAYVTNKVFVFESKTRETSSLLKELLAFFACRAATGMMDLAIMWISVDRLHMNDLIVKVISNLLVIVINYIFSKLIIFRKR